MWESRKGWTRFVLFALCVLTLAVGSCIKSAVISQDDAPALVDSLSPADELYLLQNRYVQAEALARSGQDFAALDTLRNLFFDLRAPGRADSTRWALQLATTREMSRLLEKTGPDPSEGEGISSIDFKMQLFKDSLSNFGTDSMAELESALSEEQPDIESDSLLEEVMLEPDSLAIRHLSLPDIPDCDRDEVSRMVDYFATGRGHKFYQIWLDRYPKVAPVIRRVLQEEGMPEDLIFLAMIESGFRTTATSRARARGPWQFVTGTAHLFDLRVDYWMDERLDLERSTRAACRFLRKLYDRYDDWYMAMAAYNWGPGRIDRAVRRGVTEYWAIGRMPSETRAYVPTYLAARRVFQDYELYGFTLGEPVAPPDLELVQVEGSIRLGRLADLFDIEEERLRDLNHHLVQGSTPPDGGHVYVPSELAGLCRDRLQELPQSAFQDWVRHKVRRGETVASIAKRYGLSSSDLRHANGLASRARLKSGRVLLIPMDADARAARAESVDRAERESPGGNPPAYHKVRRGETLSSIARRYGMGVSEVAQANNLGSRTRLKTGQRLRIPGAGDELSASIERSTAKPPSTHVVKRGESLSSIARHYGLSIAELAASNKLGVKAKLKAGRKLRIPGREPEQLAASAPSREPDTSTARLEQPAHEDGQKAEKRAEHKPVVLPKHKVRKGEALDRIAHKYGVSVSKLMAWNQLARADRIFPGQELLLADPDSVERIDSDQNRDLAQNAPPDPAPRERKGKSGKVHVVRAGETAGGIAARYDISVKELVAANGLGKRAKIVLGQRLRIPGSSAGPQQVIHVVKSGESLWSLARQYKVGVADIRRWNNLRGSEIHAGARLVIILSEEG